MILVVDDDQAVVDLLGVAITRRGYRVETAHDGLEAYEHLKHPNCKCMLLDINMPRVNGAELLLLMQAEGIRVPTIVMAGAGDFDAEEMKGFDNVVAFFKKPLALDRLLDAIDRAADPPEADREGAC